MEGERATRSLNGVWHWPLCLPSRGPWTTRHALACVRACGSMYCYSYVPRVDWLMHWASLTMLVPVPAGPVQHVNV